MYFGIERRMKEIDAQKQMENPKVAEAVEGQLVELTRAESIHSWPPHLSQQILIFMEEAGEVVKAANDVIHKTSEVINNRSKLVEELDHAGAMILRIRKNLE